MNTSDFNQTAHVMAAAPTGPSEAYVAYEEIGAVPPIFAAETGLIISNSWTFSGILGLVVIGILVLSRFSRRGSNILH